MAGGPGAPIGSKPGKQAAAPRQTAPTQTMAVTPGDATSVNLDTCVHGIELGRYAGRAKRGNRISQDFTGFHRISQDFTGFHGIANTQLDVIQYAACSRWYHCTCLKKYAIIGIRPCKTCRRMPAQIQNGKEMATALTRATYAISTSNNQLREKDTQISALTEDDRNLTKEMIK